MVLKKKWKTKLFINRAKKFGIEAPEVVDDKKKSRAERFGLPTPAANGGAAKKGAAVDPEMEAKKKSRAERFGLTVNQKRVSFNRLRIPGLNWPSLNQYFRRQNLKAQTSQLTPKK